MGCETWPDDALYARCPECGEKTDRFKNAGRDLLGDHEAASKLLRIQFEKFYERWDARRDPRRVEADAPAIDVEGNLARSRADAERLASELRAT